MRVNHLHQCCKIALKSIPCILCCTVTPGRSVSLNTLKWVCNPFWTDSIVVNESCVTSVIAGLTPFCTDAKCKRALNLPWVSHHHLQINKVFIILTRWATSDVRRAWRKGSHGNSVPSRLNGCSLVTFRPKLSCVKETSYVLLFTFRYGAFVIFGDFPLLLDVHEAPF